VGDDRLKSAEDSQPVLSQGVRQSLATFFVTMVNQRRQQSLPLRRRSAAEVIDGIRTVQLWLQLASIQGRPRESAPMRASPVTCGDALLRTPPYTPGATC
jgi:hypothetical protein